MATQKKDSKETVKPVIHHSDPNRAMYAAAAMQSLYHLHGPVMTPLERAHKAFEMADAMISVDLSTSDNDL